jgi:hypothetical protein
MIWISVGKFALGIVLIPLFITLYINRATKLEGDFKEKWLTKNIFSLIIIISFLSGVFLEIKSYKFTSQRNIEDEKLLYFDFGVYKEELDSHQPVSEIDWGNEKEQLLRIFEHAEYAWESGDYEEARDALQSLKRGKDEFGNMYRFQSFSVNNNLGCLYFEIKRNKDFDSIIHYLIAKEIVGSKEPYRSRIDENIKKLDRMVNTID